MALLQYIRGDVMLCVVVLPSLSESDLLVGDVRISRWRGDSQGRSNYFNSRSPLSEPVLFFFYCFCFIRVGEITQGSTFILTLVLPSLNRFVYWRCLFISYSMSGRFTGEEINFQLSFSPLLTKFYPLFKGLILTPFFDHIYFDQIFYDPRLCGGMHSGRGHLLCIYIV